VEYYKVQVGKYEAIWNATEADINFKYHSAAGNDMFELDAGTEETITRDLVPQTHATHNLGRSGRAWDDVHASTITATTRVVTPALNGIGGVLRLNAEAANTDVEILDDAGNTALKVDAGTGVTTARVWELVTDAAVPATIRQTGAGNALVWFQKEDATPVDTSIAGALVYSCQNDAGEYPEGAAISVWCDDVTAGTEDYRIQVATMSAGGDGGISPQTRMEIGKDTTIYADNAGAALSVTGATGDVKAWYDLDVAGALDVTGALTVTGVLTANTTTNYFGEEIYHSATRDGGYPLLYSRRLDTTPTSGDQVAGWHAIGKDDAGNVTDFVRTRIYATDVTNTSEDCKYLLQGVIGGSYVTLLQLTDTVLLPQAYGDNAGAGALALYMKNDGQIGTAATSSRRFKCNIRPAPKDAGLPFIMKLRTVMFDRIDGTTHDEIGLIAEEVYEAGQYPYIVPCDDKGQPITVNYGELNRNIPLAIQQQEAKIEAQAAQIEALTKRADAQDRLAVTLSIVASFLFSLIVILQIQIWRKKP
jgi:hypothetical protein